MLEILSTEINIVELPCGIVHQ